MTREMRRKDRQLTDAAAKQILEQGEYGILSTADEAGIPYGVPLSYAFQNNTIYFHCAKDTGLKAANIASQPQVCFTVVGKTKVLPEKFSTLYESAIAFGTARKAADKRIGLTLLQEKYSPGLSEAGIQYIEQSLSHVEVYEIEIESLTGKGRN